MFPNCSACLALQQASRGDTDVHFLEMVRNGLVKYILKIFLINLIGPWCRELGQVFCDLFEPCIGVMTRGSFGIR